jgi:diguanylate cyclase (GGDEF)-like protein
MTGKRHGATSARADAPRTFFSRLLNSPLWRTPAKPLILILAVEALCVTCLVAANVKWATDWASTANLTLLFVMSVVCSEAINRVEIFRRYLAAPTGVYFDATGLWMLAGAIVLPVGLAGVLAVLIGIHTLISYHRTAGSRLLRVLYSIATDVAATLAAAMVFTVVAGGAGVDLGSTRSAVGILLAVATLWSVNSVLIWAVVYLVQRPERLRDLVGRADEEFLEISMFSLGALLAVMVHYAPILSPLVLVVMVVVRRSGLVGQLQEQATRDTRTGLLNAGAWRSESERELDRSARSGADVSLLMIDLDHFKALNDTYGHQAGDRALKAVAECLTETLRGYDAVGRYGGEEFAALLVDADELTGEAVAERVCAKIREIDIAGGIRVTASIGVATAPAARTDLDGLISRADAALYVAKNQGRDRVRPARSLTGIRTDHVA